MPLCVSNPIDFLDETRNILREYAFRPDANEPVFRQLRAGQMTQALGWFSLDCVSNMTQELPKTLADARNRWYRPATVS